MSVRVMSDTVDCNASRTGTEDAAAAAAELWIKRIQTRHMAARKLTSLEWDRSGPARLQNSADSKIGL